MTVDAVVLDAAQLTIEPSPQGEVAGLVPSEASRSQRDLGCPRMAGWTASYRCSIVSLCSRPLQHSACSLC